MLQSAAEAEAHLESGPSLLGPGWREVESFEDLSDEDEYTTDEEEIYAVLDFGQAIDRQTLQTESQYQLIGIDTPLPFIKLGSQIYQGEMTSIIGDEVILSSVRNPDNPSQPTHPPLHTVNKHFIFRPITLFPKDTAPPISTQNNPKSQALPIEVGPPKRKGRPPGAISKPRIFVLDDEEVKALDLGSLPDNVVIEVGPPAEEGEPVQHRTILNKAQAERIKLGLPPNIRRRKDPDSGIKIYTSKTGRRAKERAAAASAEGTPLEEGSLADGETNAEAGPSRTSGTAVKPNPGRKGKTPVIPQEEPMDTEDFPEDVPLGGLYLTAHDPVKGSRPRAKKTTKPVKRYWAGANTLPKMIDDRVEGDGSAEVNAGDDGGGRERAGSELQELAAQGDVEMQDGYEMEVQEPGSPLMDMNNDGTT